MAESSTENWEYHCTYELRPNALKGKHQILSLENMLISLGTKTRRHDARCTLRRGKYYPRVYSTIWKTKPPSTE